MTRALPPSNPFRVIAHRFPVFCMAVALAAVSAHAASVRGQVMHQNGKPAGEIAVTISDHKDFRSSPAKVGSDGMYYLANIPAGQYYLEVWVNPKTPQVYQVTVSEPNTDMPRVTVP
ncbi:MAG TPA: carboxypeptidase-like regulatory domain-containing protein [Terracidiphilus sp.]|nr:carboxypeptidase-like regulatory domain-containing protein [Terracidiphilus sp.]